MCYIASGVRVLYIHFEAFEINNTTHISFNACQEMRIFLVSEIFPVGIGLVSLFLYFSIDMCAIHLSHLKHVFLKLAKCVCVCVCVWTETAGNGFIQFISSRYIFRGYKSFVELKMLRTIPEEWMHIMKICAKNFLGIRI